MKQITTHSIAVIIGILTAFILLKSCESKPIIKTPEIHGEFKAVKPKQTPIVESKKETIVNGINEFLQQQINLLLSENDKLKQAFVDAPDSTKIKMYEDCTQLNSFTHTWDNDTIQATSYGIVRGEVQEIGLKYTIKPIQIPKQKETVFRLLAGGGVGINKELNQLTYFGSVGYQNSKGNITFLQYQRFGNSEFVTFVKTFSIWNYKK